MPSGAEHYAKSAFKAWYRNYGLYSSNDDPDLPHGECVKCSGLTSPGGYRAIDRDWQKLKDMKRCVCKW